MTPERVARLVAGWVRLYTRNLPAPKARRRIEEIDADLQDHIAHERARGTRDRRIAMAVADRMVRGLAADLSWRRRAKEPMSTSSRSATRVAVVTACVLLVPLVAMQLTEEVNWSVGDFVFAAVLLSGSGLLLELALRRPRTVAYRVATAAVGVAAMALGEADDAPGLVGFGLLLVLGTLALTLKTARSSA